jgi:hypothetical protein
LLLETVECNVDGGDCKIKLLLELPTEASRVDEAEVAVDAGNPSIEDDSNNVGVAAAPDANVELTDGVVGVNNDDQFEVLVEADTELDSDNGDEVPK